MKIPYYSFQNINKCIEADFKKVMEEVFDSKWYLLGKKLTGFESKFSKYLNISRSIGVGSGLDALYISLKSLGIGEGDEVILPSHTFFATALAVIHTGAKPVLAEVDSDTMNIDPENIAPLISSRTKGIIAVHLYGHPADMDPILEIAQTGKIPVIEDFAQSVGASYKNRKCGTMGIVNACSFYPVKNLGALGDGGAITTDNPELAEFCFKFRNYGSSTKHYYEEAGINSRLDEIQAAILQVKLIYLDRWNKERKEIAGLYIERLKDLSGLKLLPEKSDCEASWHVFPVRAESRNQLQDHLHRKGIETNIHYKVPMHVQTGFQKFVKDYKKGDLPIAEEIADTELSLPIYPGLKLEEIDYITDQIKTFFVRK